jgi:hypothetical protein
METEGSLPHSQEPTTCPYPERNIHLQEGYEIVLSPSRICNIFNKTFTDMVNKLVLGKNVTHPQINNNNNNSIISIKDSLVLLEITKTDLIKVIQSMNNKKSAGLDDILPYTKKVCSPHNNTPFRSIQCFNQRRHPPIHTERKSVIIPIY